MLLGAGGHSRVVLDILLKNGIDDILIFDDNSLGEFEGFKIVGSISESVKYKDRKAIIAIGSNEVRKKISNEYDLNYGVAIHPAAVISSTANIGAGSVVMANVVVNSGSNVGNHVILNTGAIIEHDNDIDDYSHICPGVTLGGNVRIGKSSWIGIGSTVKNNICIGDDILIGAGSVVINDISKKGTYKGIVRK